ncbi:MAG: long-chain fatty acid--CoA ligase [Hormoscilla sp. SP5CHS1]|nr:long-chain fatty acid--CoA ligase [Hormoscilla sp. SP12CHS1]MBC6453275.1 long-chain fatty acid--CoA ligase [Hormoscilla sp. SP5CHS1]
MNASIKSRAHRLTDKERACLAKMVDYSSLQSIPEIWPLAAEKFGDAIALWDPHAQPAVQLTYRELNSQIQQFASGLQALGVKPGSRISLIADNSPRWFIADQGMMRAGAANAVRSSLSDPSELLYIIENSESTAIVVENLATLEKLRTGMDDLPIKSILLLSDEAPPSDEVLPVRNFSQLMEIGLQQQPQAVSQNHQTLATLIYTSGTTGKPKGAMLSHGNLLHQMTNLGVAVQPQLGDRVLSILPSWHVYERTAEYFFLSQGATQIYTNRRQFKNDLKKYMPVYMVGVPRLWESIYEGIQKQFREQPASKQKLVNNLLNISGRYIAARRLVQGLDLNNLTPGLPQRLLALVPTAALFPLHALADWLVYQKVRAGIGDLFQVISGGGSLAMHLDNFFEIIGVEILVGYGLTETSPVLTARRSWDNLRGSAGQPIPGTAIMIADPDTGQSLPSGVRGLVLARGPQLMQGYYQNPQATAKAINSAGWFDTGDLGWLTPQNHLVLTGRAKDTIVLTNGENIEPQPIEDACARSPYIDQIMLVGQDRKFLGALIVPNTEALAAWAKQRSQAEPWERGVGAIDMESKAVEDLIRQELAREVKNRPGYRPDDRIGPLRLIREPFSIENGMMTQTLKIKRPVVTERYRDIIDGMFT